MPKPNLARPRLNNRLGRIVQPLNQFQFTLPRGERLAGDALGLQPVAVSIHAPAWGATPTHTPPPHHPQVSIHAPAWGATQPPPRYDIYKDMFQFTLPRGERPYQLGIEAADIAFQFTLPRGERQGVKIPSLTPSLFQFTLPRGERHDGRF